MSADDQLVPRNRWDLLGPAPERSVAVVVTHFEQGPALARTLDAVAGQTRPPAEIVVADDGSATSPRVPDGVRLVRQEDLGFRAAAARNLGAAATTSEVLVFLDADTTPEPDYLQRLLPRVDACPDVLAVGRRRHADLSATGTLLTEPSWLVEGYEQTADLLHADGRSFRFVISAVMACRRSLFTDLGGFDERFVGYGGEDWDLAYRAWNNGAVLVHERGAVAWHDGPEWADRSGDGELKKFENARLATLIPEPSMRGGAPAGELPDVLDLSVIGVPTPDQLRRARAQLSMVGTLPEQALRDLTARLADDDLGQLVLTSHGREVGALTSTRALGRARRWPGRPDVLGSAFGRASVDVSGTVAAPSR